MEGGGPLLRACRAGDQAVKHSTDVAHDMQHWLDDQVLVRLKAERFDHLCALLAKATHPKETIEDTVTRLVATCHA